MVKDNIVSDIKISQYSKIKVYWDDRPENYSKEAKNKIINHFSKKYGVNKNNINVIYRPVKFNDNGDTIEINGATIENILDTTYQRELMKEWIKRENKNVDFNRLLKLDDKVNAELNIENEDVNNVTWSIKWVTINNFLSFGSDNYIPFNKLKGLTVVNSSPANQGGKTTLTIDSLKFLLHGNTTKTDKNEEIFNQFSDKNELIVRGMIEISGEEIIIERKMKRSAKKGGGWTVVNKVNYYKLLPDGEEEQQNEEDAIRTTAKIRSSIGSEKDFEMLVLATEKNLDDLIGLSTTESSKTLTRLIGLEVIENKESIVRKMYNEFDRNKKSNHHNIITLTDEISEHENKISSFETLSEDSNSKLEDSKNEIIRLSNEKDRLLNSKVNIDVTITTLNPSKLENEIEIITQNGKDLVDKKSDIENKIIQIGDIEFDEDTHHKLTKDYNKLTLNIELKNNEISRTEETIENLVQGGICKSCNRKLDDVDNTEHIENHNKELSKFKNELNTLNKEKIELESVLENLNNSKKLVDTKNKLELEKDKTDVEIGSLRNKIVAKKNDLKKYKLNQDGIELNRNIDSDVSYIKTQIEVQNKIKDDLTTKIFKISQEIENNKENIISKNKLIEDIKKEAEVEKLYKIYIELFGKKGISKLVLRSVLPIINSEIQRLLEDVCDFEIEIFIDDKNDIQFLLNKDGVSKPLKSGSGFEKTASSLVLRCVLGKISTLPMPNFITFDEVLGKVANENIEKLKPLFDKVKNMYEIVFLITHNDIIKDWGDNIITVEKENNISKIKIK
jgi:DNA repair exonuclease SbcCD ATPase subunit